MLSERLLDQRGTAATENAVCKACDVAATMRGRGGHTEAEIDAARAFAVFEMAEEILNWSRR